MAVEWHETTIGELGDVIGGATPSTRDPENFDGSIPWLTPRDLSDNRTRWIRRGARNLSEKGLQSCSAQLLPRGTVLLTSRAPIGYVALAANPVTTNQGFRNIVVNRYNDAEFLYYWLKGNLPELERHATGSTFKELSGSALKGIKLRVPPLPEQRAIAHILGTLDDKIELNRKTAATLEAMAQALFKAWFVDFEPVRAKMEGRWRRGESLPGLPAHLFDLFPDRLVDTDQGEIPEGWEVGPLGKFFVLGPAGTWGEDQANAHATIPARCLRGIDCHHLAEGLFPDVPLRWFSDKQLTKLALKDGVILFEGSGSFCGRSLVWDRGYNILFEGAVTYSNFCKRLDPTCSVDQARVCWMQIREAYRDGILEAFKTGTAFPNFDVGSLLRTFAVRVPPTQLCELFCKLTSVHYRVLLLRESYTLAALRDALLPKLVSGELRVKDAERFLAERGL